MKTLSFVIDGKPQANQRPRRNRYGFFYTPKESKDFQKLFTFKSMEVKVKEKVNLPIKGPIEVYIYFFLKQPIKFKGYQRPDIDNLGKNVLDGMNKSFFDDDSQINSLRLKKLFIDQNLIEHTQVELIYDETLN